MLSLKYSQYFFQLKMNDKNLSLTGNFKQIRYN